MKHIEMTCNSLAECCAMLRKSDMICLSDMGHKAKVTIDIDPNSPFDDSLIRVLDYSEEIDQDFAESYDNDLLKEIERYFQGYWPGIETSEQCNTDMHFTPPAIVRLAEHFANWRKAQYERDLTDKISAAYLFGALPYALTTHYRKNYESDNKRH